ncbi:signal transduction histidine kinase [Methylobacterium sp. PvP062]|uniref:histidine kinase n=1 Tax=Methylobacterium radiotolerans TaxID=31998 RepID=A0ABV2NK44_9HYPH|nr:MULTISPECIES: HAMP domain-containing sensor histidine kinase [Methylobacterium]MCX7334358.1 HAMP domain-containing sensor histidine kinase [Hyphomicrobiales bacterium]GAN46749.1 integral membrane sensor signal transduction histidine kinase [Methylobacterium sp. ME121]KZB98252.1 Globin-coupled histidine kinase [Methylobacterium radiotolerans]MBN6822980.1 HAMP domain-containing histidine kinase [Methylobacterium organophilum]MBP2496407.1 signal transduction histidine kinase [Methylobacterium 
MTAYSLRARLLALWVLLLASAAATAYLMLGVYDQSTGVQVAQADLAVGRACREIIDRYAALVRARGKGSAEADLVGTLSTALARFPGLEGGIWSAARGSVAYAYPTYEGSGPKTDFPAAERDAIAALNAQALRVDHAVSERRPSRTQVLMLQACPLHGPEAGLTAWSMTRAHVNDGPTYTRFLAGLGFLAVTVLGSAAFLSWFLYGFSGRIARLEAALAAPRPDGQDLPHLDRTGERELDRLVDALNAAGGRLREAQARIVATERLAAVGRLAASVAHEIRNPIAAMRLKAENALVSGDPHRTAAALEAVLGQIARVDTLLRDLLNLTQARPLNRMPTPVEPLLAECAHLHEELASARSVRIAVAADGLPATDHPHLDRAQIARAVDNLLLNALQHAPPGGRIRLGAERATVDGALRLRLSVADTGAGVDPVIRAGLFEPFVTGRPDGTGLGLAIVREIALAHRGEARLVEGAPETTFVLDLPWQPS